MRFSHSREVRPCPFKCKNLYLVFALEKKTVAQAVFVPAVFVCAFLRLEFQEALSFKILPDSRLMEIVPIILF